MGAGSGVSVTPIRAAPSYAPVREVPLSYDQLRDFLHDRGLGRPSRRWLQYRRAEGMPCRVTLTGRVVFVPSEVVGWLEDRQRRAS